MINHLLTKVFLISLLLLSFGCNSGVPDVSKYPNTEEGNSQKIKDLTEYLNNNKKSAEAYFLRGKAYLESKLENPGVEDLKKAIEIDSNNVEYLRFTAQTYEKLPFIKGALILYKRLTVLEPKNIDNFQKLGELYFYIKAKGQSMENLAKVIEMDKFQKQAYYFRGLNFKEDKKIPEAIRSFGTVIELDPNHYGALMQMGFIFAEKKDWKAYDYYKRAINSKPNDRESLYARGYFLQTLDSLNLAIKDYKSILEIIPDDKNAAYNLGFIYYKMKNFQESENYFTLAIQSDDKYAEAWYGRGITRKELGKKEDAEYDIQHSKNLTPLYGEKEFLEN